MTKAETDTTSTPDARLIELGAEMATLNRRQDALWQQEMGATTQADRDDAHEAASAGTDRYYAILKEMQHTPAHTRESEQVKARAILRWLSPEDEVPDAGSDGIVAWSVAHDVLRRREDQIAPAVPASPDADLIALCDSVVRIEQEVRDRFRSGDNPLDETIEASCQPRWRERVHLIKRMGRLRATTPDGFAARARAVVAVNQEHDNAYDAEGTVPHTLI